MAQALKPVVVKALVAYGPIEAFDESIITRFSGSAEIKLQTVLPSPLVENFSCEFRSVTHHQRTIQQKQLYRKMSKEKLLHQIYPLKI